MDNDTASSTTAYTALARFRLVTLQLACLSGSGVAWNGNSGEVFVPDTYRNQVCGLCGNFMPPAVSIRGANGALVAPAAPLGWAPAGPSRPRTRLLRTAQTGLPASTPSRPGLPATRRQRQRASGLARLHPRRRTREVYGEHCAPRPRAMLPGTTSKRARLWLSLSARAVAAQKLFAAFVDRCRVCGGDGSSCGTPVVPPDEKDLSKKEREDAKRQARRTSQGQTDSASTTLGLLASPRLAPSSP